MTILRMTNNTHIEHEFRKGEKVIVTCDDSTKKHPNFANKSYPKKGWTGILKEPFAVGEWIIEWDFRTKADPSFHGCDLVYCWMIEAYVEEWNKEENER